MALICGHQMPSAASSAQAARLRPERDRCHPPRRRGRFSRASAGYFSSKYSLDPWRDVRPGEFLLSVTEPGRCVSLGAFLASCDKGIEDE
jgi:hypothetical protein